MKVEQKAEKNPCVISLTVKADAEEIKGEARKVLNTFIRGPDQTAAEITVRQ